MEENKKTMTFTKRGLIWYTVCSFLLVTLLIFLAVLITHSQAVKSIGATYAKQLALASSGVTEAEVSDLTALHTYYGGRTAFEVSFYRGGERHVVYIDAQTAEIAQKTTGGASGLEQPSEPSETPLPSENATEDELHRHSVNDRIYR